jgi:hypothetical protein
MLGIKHFNTWLQYLHHWHPPGNIPYSFQID